MTSPTDLSPALQRLVQEDAVAQLRAGTGRMAELGSEGGKLMLDWVEGVERLLLDGDGLERVEAEAQAILDRGIRHVIWAGMGGSVMAVRVLTDLGFCGEDSPLRIYALDSTDPAALNAIVRAIAASKGLLPSSDLHPGTLFDDVLMVAVSMGMTSEEPITHLEWFLDLLDEVRLPAADHTLVMTLPGSYLDGIADERGIPRRPLQLDGGTGTPGRMSAPTTRVFLLPAALALAGESADGARLRAVLGDAWRTYDLRLAQEDPARHPFVRLAAALSDAAVEGVCRLLLRMSSDSEPLLPWIEQLMEESLGKGGKGVLVFPDQPVGQMDDEHRPARTIRVAVGVGVQEDGAYVLDVPNVSGRSMAHRLAALAANFLGWQLVMALYGYLHDITFVGQPAVEDYKARSRTLRRLTAPLDAALEDGVALAMHGATLVGPPETRETAPAAALADAVLRVRDQLQYLDLTVNGELPEGDRERIERALHALGNEGLQVPVKLRRAPAAYHSTEQSEMDGPPHLLSLRAVMRRHEPALLGCYADTFLAAQAVATWQAMNEGGRECWLLILDGEGNLDPLLDLLDNVGRLIRG